MAELESMQQDDGVSLSSVSSSVPQKSKNYSEVDRFERELITFAWKYSRHVNVLIGNSAESESMSHSLIMAEKEPGHVAKVDLPLQGGESVWIQSLAKSWDINLGKGREDTASLCSRLERQRRTGGRYLLMIVDAHVLEDEHWRLLRSLYQGAKGAVGVVLAGGERLRRQCDKFLSPFGIACEYITLSAVQFPVASPSSSLSTNPIAAAKKDMSSGRKTGRYLGLAGGIALLAGAIYFQHGIWEWMNPTMSRQSTMPTNHADTMPAKEIEPELKELMSNQGAEVVEVQLDAVEKPTVEPERQAEVESIDSAEEVVATAQSPVDELVDKEPSVVVEEKLPLLVDGLRADAWILEQPSSHYALRIMSLRSEDRLQSLIREKGLEDQAAYYRARRSSGNWYVMIYGNYETSEQALNEKAEVEKRLHAKGALVRKYQEFQKDIASSQ